MMDAVSSTINPPFSTSASGRAWLTFSAAHCELKIICLQLLLISPQTDMLIRGPFNRI